MVWLWDERLFDHARSEFTPDAFLADAVDRFGGLDAVVLWQAYPIIGIDERNQCDFYLDVPGLAELVAAFQRAGVRVFVDYNPWDSGDRRRRRATPSELAALAADVGADGVFLDTMSAGGAELRAALARSIPHRCSRASRGCPSNASSTTRRAGRSGSPTARCRGCCGRTGTSGGT